MFLYDVGQVLTSTLALTSTAIKLASTEVASGKRRGRNALEVCNTGTSTAYIGASNVTVATGIPVPANTSKIIPVNDTSINNLYIVGSGNIILAEYFS